MKKWIVILPVLLLVLSILACGSASPPESCGADIGGIANETLFGDNFASMDLVNANTWQPGASGDNGTQFAKEPLLIMFDARKNVDIRACIQNTQGGGKIAFDETSSFKKGSNEFQLGDFEPGSYVIRVIVDGVLVKNFPFEIK
jgi:hypothetical protein